MPPLPEPRRTTDFSDTDELNNWFRRFVWTANPNDWDLETLINVEAESFAVRRELDRRMAEIGRGRLDGALFWSGLGLGLAGAALLAFPVATIPVALSTGLTLSGVGTTLSGAARGQVLNEQRLQLQERSRDLTRLQARLAAIKRTGRTS